MRDIILLSILFTTNIYSLECFSQENTNKERYAFALRTSITHYITGETPLTFEKFREKNSYELGISIITPSPIWISTNNQPYYINPDAISRLYNKGFSLRAQYKFLLITEENNSKFYISPRLVLRHTWKNKENVRYTEITDYSSKHYTSIESEKQTIVALSLLVGKEYFVKNFTFDIFGGFGIRTNTVYDRFIYSNNIRNYKSGFYKVQPTLSLGIALGYCQYKNN
ncbi:MAG: hypothetical protein WCK02_04605 [Bacteroidota bacterium]